MEHEKQELRKLEKSTAKAHFSFALGLGSFAILVQKFFDSLWWVILVVLATIFLISCIYFKFFSKGKRKKCIELASKVRIDDVAFFIGFVSLGLGLKQYDWGLPWALLCTGMASLILGIGVGLWILNAGWSDIIPSMRRLATRVKKND